MRAAARATATTPRHLLERRRQEPKVVPDQQEAGLKLVVLDDLVTTLEGALARANELREQQRRTPTAA